MEEKDLVRRYLGRADNDIVWEFIRMAISSVAHYAIIPMQDILNLDTDARMNTPSTLGGNWAWRYRPEALDSWSSNRLRELVDLYGRDPELWRQKISKSIEVENA
jgi:4-alpha-glucanotransferase